MIDADQRWVVSSENDTAGIEWFHPAFDTIQETPYSDLGEPPAGDGK